MLQSFLVVLSSVVTLFLMMAVGFFFARGGMLSGETISQLSRILLYVVTPATVVSSFLVERTPEGDRQLFTAAAALVGTYALYMLLSGVLFRGRKPEERGVLRFSSIYGNTGFMGLPLIRATLGNEAAMVAIIALAVFDLSTWTHGFSIIGGGRLSVRKAVLNPAVIGFAAGLLLYLTGLRLPGPVDSAVGYLGSLYTPLAMIIIGGQAAAVELRSAFRDTRLYQVSALKLLAMPLVTMLVLLPLHLDGTIFLTLVILSGCPVAGVTSLFCQMLERNTTLAARLVTLSTLLSIATLPLTALAAQAFIS